MGAGNAPQNRACRHHPPDGDAVSLVNVNHETDSLSLLALKDWRETLWAN
jgi:hypothetical protein